MHRIQGRHPIYQSSQSEMLVTTLDDSARMVGCLNPRRNTMLNTHLKLAAAALLASAALVGSAHAQTIEWESSNTAKVKIGESTVDGGPHSPEEVGINVPNLDTDDYVDFLGLKNVIGTDGNGVTTFTATTTDVDDHSTYGRFDFAQVGSEDVWYGEWSQTGSASAGDHTVYYGGTGATSAGNMPSSGTVNYSVKGISDYATNSILSGTFTADFDYSELTGYIQASNGYKVDIGTADIIGSTIDGNGAVASNSGGTLASGGDVRGQFFGSSAQALAGIVTFSNNQYDTAFGGN